MLLSRLAHVSQEVAATSARSRKTALLAELFRDAGADDVPIVIPYLRVGRAPSRRLPAEWGHGRRTGKLSNLRLGARTGDDSFAMPGKTF